MVENITNTKLQVVGLYRKNYATSFHTRLLASLLEKNHVTLLPHLKSLVKENILVAKTIGRNKSYSLNLANVVTKNYILMAELVASTLLQNRFPFLKKLTELNLPGCLVVFGSYAKGKQKKESDVDVFYLGNFSDKHVKSLKDLGIMYGKTVNVKGARVSVFDKAIRKGDFLVKEIVKYHCILQNPDVFVNALWSYYCEIKD